MRVAGDKFGDGAKDAIDAMYQQDDGGALT
jgi:hypothetical protein